MPVVSQAGNQVTWNHFFFGADSAHHRNQIDVSDFGLEYRHDVSCGLPFIRSVRGEQFRPGAT
jgi:hypothetical protein